MRLVGHPELADEPWFASARERVAHVDELDGAVHYLPEKNLVDRSRVDLSGVTRPLFADPAAEGRRYFAKTGLYPINHGMVVRRSLLEQHPWIALNLYSAFVAAKEPYLAALRSGTATGKQAEKDRKLMEVVGDDPVPYGLEANRASIEALIRYAHQQGLIPRPYKAEEMFLPL